MDAFGSGRLKVNPPIRGIFPPDHKNECGEATKKYMSCLNEMRGDQFKCKSMAREYFECRMEKNLMAKENLDDLGLSNNQEYSRKEIKEFDRSVTGFVGGVDVASSKKSRIFFKGSRD